MRTWAFSWAAWKAYRCLDSIPLRGSPDDRFLRQQQQASPACACGLPVRPAGYGDASQHVPGAGHAKTKREIVGVVHVGEGTLSKRVDEFSETAVGALTVQEFDEATKAADEAQVSPVPRLWCWELCCQRCRASHGLLALWLGFGDGGMSARQVLPVHPSSSGTLHG